MGNVLEGGDADWAGPRPADPSRQSSAYIQDSRDRWTFRRLLTFAAAGFLGFLLFWLTVFGDGANGVQLALAGMLPVAFVGLVTTYVVGPIADDWLQLRVNRAA